jgi:nucleoside-diphosphate-sugar epimerase
MSGTVLVTGSSGFIGSYLVRELAATGHRVVGLDLVPPTAESRFIQVDAASTTQLVLGSLDQWPTVVRAVEHHRPDTIVHNASYVRPDVLAREPLTALRMNVETTLTVFEAARTLGVSRVVYMSSIGVLPPARYQPIDANHPVITAREGTPDTFYGAAKIASEAFAFAYHHGFGLDTLIVRPSAVYGFGMRWPIYIKPMVEDALLGRPTRFETGGDMPRDYTHAADVAALVRCCVDVPAERVRDRVFHVGTGRRPVTAGEVAQVVRELVPEADIEIGPGLGADEERDAATRGAFDMTAAHEQLGFTPSFADIRAGIADYISCFRRYQEQTATDTRDVVDPG